MRLELVHARQAGEVKALLRAARAHARVLWCRPAEPVVDGTDLRGKHVPRAGPGHVRPGTDHGGRRLQHRTALPIQPDARGRAVNLDGGKDGRRCEPRPGVAVAPHESRVILGGDDLLRLGSCQCQHCGQPNSHERWSRHRCALRGLGVAGAPPPPTLRALQTGHAARRVRLLGRSRAFHFILKQLRTADISAGSVVGKVGCKVTDAG